jgi:hypothetical protein
MKSNGKKQWNIQGVQIEAGTEKAAIKKFRRDIYTPGSEAYEAAIKSAQDQLEAVLRPVMVRHYWYVELVVLSKLCEMLGREPAPEEIRSTCQRLATPDGMEHIVYHGGKKTIIIPGQESPEDKPEDRPIPLISYSANPNFDQATNRVWIDYRR